MNPADAAPQTVLVTGATGFVGSAVVAALRERDYAVRALVRSPRPDAQGITHVEGDVTRADDVARAADGCDAVIHLVGIITEKPSAGVTFEKIHVGGTRAVLDGAANAGVTRYVHMSALGTRPDAVSTYHRTKWAAEELVRDSGTRWTMFRPGMIHGPRGEFMRQAAGWARGRTLPFLFMPYFGSGVVGLGGAGRIQPVYVDDVAAAFAEAVTNEKSVGRIYNLAGPDVMTWPQMYAIIADAVAGRKRPSVPIPAWYARVLTKVAPASLLPFNADQVTMSQEDNVGDTTEFRHDFDIVPRPFSDSLRGYAAEL